MNTQDAVARILASVYDAMLDDAQWPATSALIDEACGLTGNALLIGEGPKDDIRALFVGFYRRGQRHEDMEREHLEVYHPLDERVPRVRELPDSRLVHVHDVYTAEELKTSRTYNELLSRGHAQDALNVRLDASRGSYITWSLGDPVASDGWGSSQITMIERLLPISDNSSASGRRWSPPRRAPRPRPPCSTTRGSASSTWTGAGRSWRSTTAPVASCGAAMGCGTGTGGCAPARRPTSAGSTGWCAPRCRPRAPSRSAGR